MELVEKKGSVEKNGLVEKEGCWLRKVEKIEKNC